MRKLLGLTCVMVAMSAPGLFAAFDGTVLMNWGNNPGYLAQTTTPAPGTPNLGNNFITYCLEENEYFVPGSTYKYILNTGAVEGGVGANAFDSHTSPQLHMDNISVATAWLYSQFRFGSLKSADQSALADDIHWLEGEITSRPTGNGATYLAQASHALAYLNGGIDLSDTLLKGDAGVNNFNVIVMNLYSTSPVNGLNTPVHFAGDTATYYLVQDQLAVVPEPTTLIAGALLILPFGASVARVLRRKIS